MEPSGCRPSVSCQPTPTTLLSLSGVCVLFVPASLQPSVSVHLNLVQWAELSTSFCEWSSAGHRTSCLLCIKVGTSSHVRFHTPEGCYLGKAFNIHGVISLSPYLRAPPGPGTWNKTPFERSRPPSAAGASISMLPTWVWMCVFMCTDISCKRGSWGDLHWLCNLALTSKIISWKTEQSKHPLTLSFLRPPFFPPC